MLKLDSSLTKENRNYLTVPVLKDFCKRNSIKIVAGSNRADIIKLIEKFANNSDENERQTLDFLEQSFKEGAKTLKIKKIRKEIEINDVILNRKVKTHFPEYEASYIITTIPQNNLDLVRYSVELDGDHLNRISFSFLVQLLTGKYPKEDSGEVIVYPIFVDVDFETGFIIGRGKPVSVLFEYNENSLKFSENVKTSYMRLIDQAIETVQMLTNYSEEEKGKVEKGFKQAVFRLLESFSFTPKEIEKKVSKFNPKIEGILNCFENVYNLKLDKNLRKSAKYDLGIFVEKFLSITYPDEEIFIKDRDAFPYRISVMDHEYVKVDETAGLRQPIQRKEAFFDNKKAVFFHKKCDKVHLCFRRLNEKYFGNKPYRVIVEAKQDVCLIDFPEYVREEDIQNVLSRILEFYTL